MSNFKALGLDTDDEALNENLVELVDSCRARGWENFIVYETVGNETVYDSNYGYGLLLKFNDIPESFHHAERKHRVSGFVYFYPCRETKEYYEAAQVKPLTMADKPDAFWY